MLYFFDQHFIMKSVPLMALLFLAKLTQNYLNCSQNKKMNNK